MALNESLMTSMEDEQLHRGLWLRNLKGRNYMEE
jgi:hypothetical protein